MIAKPQQQQQQLSPITEIEQLAQGSNGAFREASIDIDLDIEPNLVVQREENDAAAPKQLHEQVKKKKKKKKNDVADVDTNNNSVVNLENGEFEIVQHQHQQQPQRDGHGSNMVVRDEVDYNVELNPFAITNENGKKFFNLHDDIFYENEVKL
jgi:hypothetical protein